MVGTSWMAWRLGKRHWVSIRNVDDITQSMLTSRRTMRGYVTSVGDGDNFRMIHRPLLKSVVQRIFLPFWNPIPKKRTLLKGRTLGIRLAGVDAPECAHFGQPDQPFGPEAKQWLSSFLLHKTVKVTLLRKDQYGRCVGLVTTRTGWKRVNVSLALLDSGYGSVYTSTGAEYGGKGNLKRFMDAEKKAQDRRVGQWIHGKDAIQHPSEFKKSTS